MPNAWFPEKPHQLLPHLPPKTDLESKKILRALIPARAALAELKQAAELLPNQAVLIGTLPLLESEASSRIENIVTTTDRLFEHRDVGHQADPATKEALRYSESLLEGFRSLSDRPLTTRTAEDICSRIKGTQMQVRKVPGTALVRDLGDGRAKTIYTPPEGELLLRNLLHNWERFLHESTDHDPLVRMAVAHYQFEAIHPFADGNGRTGRVLNSLYLISEGLLTLPILYLSRYLIEHRDSYYRLLLEVTTKNSWEPWVLFMIQGVQETAAWTQAKIAAIRSLMEHTAEHARTQLGRIYSHELVSLVFERPYCRIQNLVETGLVARQAASRQLKALTEAGILEERTVGRDKLFLHPQLLRLLTQDTNDFAPYY